MTNVALSPQHMRGIARVRAARDEHLAALHGSHMTLREAFAYQTVLRNDPDGARRVVERAERGWARKDARRATLEAGELAALRRAQQKVSPILIAFCAHEGLDVGVVADAILPQSLALGPGDGHPWLATGSAAYEAALAEACPPPPQRNDRAVTIRSRHDPRGEAVAMMFGAGVDFQAHVGRAHVSAHQGYGLLTLPDAIPETLLTAAQGGRLDSLVDHPVLRGRYIITSSSPRGRGRTGTLISFSCPRVAMPALGAALPAGATLLFTDPALGGAAAVDDMLARMVRAILARHAYPNWSLLLREARNRVRAINLTRWRSTPLPDPTEAQVATAVEAAKRLPIRALA